MISRLVKMAWRTSYSAGGSSRSRRYAGWRALLSIGSCQPPYRKFPGIETIRTFSFCARYWPQPGRLFRST